MKRKSSAVHLAAIESKSFGKLGSLTREISPQELYGETVRAVVFAEETAA